MIVAVIMCFYHRDDLEYFKLSVDSILCQSYNSFELFIFRDGIVNPLAQQFLDSLKENTKVTVIESSSNIGLARGLNILIDRVTSLGYFDYIARMDADDISYSDRIKKQVAFMDSNPDVGLSGTFCHEFGSYLALDVKELPLKHDELVKFSVTRCPFIHPTVIFRSELFDKGFRYPVDTHLTEDLALWFELMASGEKMSNLNEVLLDFRIGDDTIKRRRGYKKSFHEMKLRIQFMLSMKCFTLKNLLFIFAKFIFHLLPNRAMALIYEKLRSQLLKQKL